LGNNLFNFDNLGLGELLGQPLTEDCGFDMLFIVMFPKLMILLGN